MTLADLATSAGPDLLRALAADCGIRWRGAKGRCPTCDPEGRREPAFAVFRGRDRAAWTCHRCHIGGDGLALLTKYQGLDIREAARELAARIGVSWEPGPRGRIARAPEALSEWPRALDPVPRELLDFGRSLWRSCSPLDSRGKAWLRSRGIETWADTLVRTATVETARLAGVPVAGWAVVPWVAPEERTVIGVRFRRPWKAEGGGRLSPKRPEGIDALYPRPGLLRRAGVTGSEMLVITEGESDALRALQAWPNASAWMLCSATAWRPSWVRLLPEAGAIVVALDADAAGRAGAEKVFGDLVRYLGEDAYRERVRVPPLREGEDLSDALERLREREAIVEEGVGHVVEAAGAGAAP